MKEMFRALGITVALTIGVENNLTAKETFSLWRSNVEHFDGAGKELFCCIMGDEFRELFKDGHKQS